MRSFFRPLQISKPFKKGFLTRGLNWVPVSHGHGIPALTAALISLTEFPAAGSTNPPERKDEPSLHPGSPVRARQPPGTDWGPAPHTPGRRGWDWRRRTGFRVTPLPAARRPVGRPGTRPPGKRRRLSRRAGRGLDVWVPPRLAGRRRPFKRGGRGSRAGGGGVAPGSGPRARRVPQPPPGLSPRRPAPAPLAGLHAGGRPGRPRRRRGARHGRGGLLLGAVRAAGAVREGEPGQLRLLR